jgi:hypothetical protein
MREFRFYPELFEYRTALLEVLAENNYQWLSHFSAVDLIHEAHGLEVCGIKDEADAIYIQCIFRALFSRWRYGCRCLKDYGDRDVGWRVKLCRDREEGDSWQSA